MCSIFTTNKKLSCRAWRRARSWSRHRQRTSGSPDRHLRSVAAGGRTRGHVSESHVAAYHLHQLVTHQPQVSSTQFQQRRRVTRRGVGDGLVVDTLIVPSGHRRVFGCSSGHIPSVVKGSHVRVSSFNSGSEGMKSERPIARYADLARSPSRQYAQTISSSCSFVSPKPPAHSV